MIDVQRLIGEVAARNGIRVESSDPAFALVTLNQLVLEDAARQISEQIRCGIVDFQDVVQKTETRAGQMLAQQVREAAEEWRGQLQRDIDTARLRAAELVFHVHRAHSRVALIRWSSAGLISAAALFGAGLWVGAHYLR